MSQTLYYGSLITLVVLLIAIFVIFISLKIYRPDLKIMKYFSLGIVMLGIAGMAGLQIVSDNRLAEMPYDPAAELYKNTDWVLNEDAGLSQLSMKHKWEENPTLENKFLYSLTLLKNNEGERASTLLKEVKRSVQNSEYLTASMVEDAINLAETLPSEDGEKLEELEESTFEPVNAILEGIKETVAKKSSFKEAELSLLATIDVERLIFLRSINGDTSEAQDELNNLLASEDMIIRNPVIKKEIAKSSMFFQQNNAAEKYFIEVIQDYPNDHESITMLSEIYLNGDYVPSEAAKQLPQYNFAKLGAVQRAIETYEKVTAQEIEEEEKTFEFDYMEQLSNELAFALVDSIKGQADKNPTIDVRMSRYFFNKGEYEKAKEYIQEMLEHKDKLGVFEQMVINTIQYNDEKAKDISDNTSFMDRRPYMEEMYQMKEDLYDSFHFPTIYGSDRTVSGESYEHFLTETIKEPGNEKISIMNIEPNDDGKITLYLGTENLEDLSKGKLKITDNGMPIEDFTLEKLTDLDGAGRSIGLVLDVSGSMEGSRIEMAKSAAASFLKQIKKYEQAELVAFNSAPSLVQAFTKNINALVSSVMSLTAGGDTNITDSLIFEMERLKNEDGHKVLFIFSDGEDEVFSQVESRAKVIDLANRYGISIFAVGFGAGYETLSEVATETGGAYIATPNEATIFSGFDSVSKMLDNVYKVTYQLDPVEYGTHIVRAQYKEASDKKMYELAAPAAGPGDETEDKDSEFDIYQMIPNTIYQNNGDTVAKLSGKGLKDVEYLSINGLEIEDYKIISDKEIEMTIPESISYGLHLVVAVNDKGEEAQTEFVVSKEGLQDTWEFGWATLYADHCEAQGTTIECIGNPSIDKFLYPSSSKMTLENEEKLTFNGLAFNVQDSKLLFFRNTLGGRNEAVYGEMTMTKQGYGEFFELKDSFASKISFNKLGFDISLLDMTYQAKRDERPGAFTAKVKFDGTGDRLLYDNTELSNIKIIKKISPLLESSVGSSLVIAPDQANIKGEISVGGLDAGVVGLSELGGGFEYDDIRKRIVINGKASGIEIAKKKLRGIPIDGVAFTTGVEFPFRSRFGLTLQGNYPLGPTGITVSKVGILADFTSYREAGFELGIGTLADPIVKEISEKINKIKIAGFQVFDMDPKKTKLIGLNISGELKNAFTRDWEGIGKGNIQFLGFDAFDTNGRYTSNVIEGKLNRGNKTYKTTVVFSDTNHLNKLVIYHEHDIVKSIFDDIAPLNAKASFEVVPSDIGRSKIRLVGQVGPFKFDLDNDDLNIFN